MSRLGPEHTRIQALLSSYLDDEVSAGERAAVEEHLKDCEVCTEELRTLGQTVEILHGLPEVAPGRSFTLRHLPVPKPRSWWHWSFPYLRSATAAAMALLVLVVSGDLALGQLGLGRSLAAPFLTLEAPADVGEESTAAAMPPEPSAAEGTPAEAPAADRVPLEAPPEAAEAPIAEELAPTQVPSDQGQAVGEAAATPAPAEARAGLTPTAAPGASPSPPPAAPPEPAAEPAPAPIVAEQPPLLTILRWAEVVLVALLIPLGLGTVVAWRLSKRRA